MDNDTQFTTRTTPWAKLGTVIDKPVTPDEALALGGLDWTVDKKPLFLKAGPRSYQEVPNRFAVLRSSDEAIFGIVSHEYELWQNHEAFAFIAGLVDDPDTAIIEAAGAVRGGRQVFMAIKFPGAIGDVLDGDAHDLYAVVRTGHDGSKAVQVIVMPLRGMCMNMMGLRSFGRNAQQRWSIQHTSSLGARLEQARDVLKTVDDYADGYREMAERMAAIDVEEADLRKLLERTLPDRPSRGQTVDAIAHGFVNSPTIREQDRCNAWGAFNAVTEYMDWGRPRSTDEGRYHAGIDGASDRLRNRTAALLLARGAR